MIEKCKFCGQDHIPHIIDTDGFICNNCYAYLYTCALCTQGHECSFENDPSPLPKQVQKVIRQGNMTMQTVIQNPERVDITCRKLCSCFSEEFGCLKANGVCGNYKEVKPNV